MKLSALLPALALLAPLLLGCDPETEGHAACPAEQPAEGQACPTYGLNVRPPDQCIYASITCDCGSAAGWHCDPPDISPFTPPPDLSSIDAGTGD